MGKQGNPLTHRPLEKLADKLEEKQVRTHDMIKPLYLLKLHQKGLAASEIGRLIGRTGGSVSNYLDAPEVPRVAELAARAVYDEKFPAGGIPISEKKLVTAIVRAELHILKTCQDLLSSVGGKFNFIDLD